MFDEPDPSFKDTPISSDDKPATKPAAEAPVLTSLADDMDDISLKTPKSTANEPSDVSSTKLVEPPTVIPTDLIPDFSTLNAGGTPHAALDERNAAKEEAKVTNCFGLSVDASDMILSETEGAVEEAIEKSIQHLKYIKHQQMPGYVSGNSGVPESLEVLGAWFLTSINHYSMEQVTKTWLSSNHLRTNLITPHPITRCLTLRRNGS